MGLSHKARRATDIASSALAALAGRTTSPPECLCDSVKDWAANRTELECRMIAPSRDVTRRLPRTVEPKVHDHFLEHVHVRQRDRWLVKVPGAKIVGDSGMVVLPDGCIAVESLYARAVLESDPSYQRPPRRPAVRKAGSYFSLIVIWAKSGNYYHWLHDTLERLPGVIDSVPDTVQFIVPATLTPLQLETLRAVGIDESRLEFFSGRQPWELEELYFAPAMSNSGSHRRDADLWLRDRLLDAYGVAPTRACRRIFVTRRGIAHRHTVNEDAVEAALRAYDFETVMPETSSLREQVQLFAEAETVVATHGSALTNILFSPPGLAVLDMVPPAMVDLAHIFWGMAEELGHEYWYLLADAVERPGARQPDVRVPIDKLEATLARIHPS